MTKRSMITLMISCELVQDTDDPNTLNRHAFSPTTMLANAAEKLNVPAGLTPNSANASISTSTRKVGVTTVPEKSSYTSVISDIGQEKEKSSQRVMRDIVQITGLGNLGSKMTSFAGAGNRTSSTSSSSSGMPRAMSNSSNSTHLHSEGNKSKKGTHTTPTSSKYNHVPSSAPVPAPVTSQAPAPSPSPPSSIGPSSMRRLSEQGSHSAFVQGYEHKRNSLSGRDMSQDDVQEEPTSTTSSAAVLVPRKHNRESSYSSLSSMILKPAGGSSEPKSSSSNVEREEVRIYAKVEGTRALIPAKPLRKKSKPQDPSEDEGRAKDLGGMMRGCVESFLFQISRESSRKLSIEFHMHGTPKVYTVDINLDTDLATRLLLPPASGYTSVIIENTSNSFISLTINMKADNIALRRSKPTGLGISSPTKEKDKAGGVISPTREREKGGVTSPTKEMNAGSVVAGALSTSTGIVTSIGSLAIHKSTCGLQYKIFRQVNDTLWLPCYVSELVLCPDDEVPVLTHAFSSAEFIVVYKATDKTSAERDSDDSDDNGHRKNDQLERFAKQVNPLCANFMTCLYFLSKKGLEQIGSAKFSLDNLRPSNLNLVGTSMYSNASVPVNFGLGKVGVVDIQCCITKKSRHHSDEADTSQRAIFDREQEMERVNGMSAFDAHAGSPRSPHSLAAPSESTTASTRSSYGKRWVLDMSMVFCNSNILDMILK
eukprot:CAMPEP_0184697594 /NCGR_PEP_ID=MMETSP0313-20130426/4513_1 /TAXON_ID=2792 /ORGANISM="Porphyridium aerugineum, Strain SAG 1380-2" /LENGTH=710 /DNA_ID=CAMNT_0027156411 /DNA_START=10 /DNA_END=2142 /DNA_ORIENTATION=+